MDYLTNLAVLDRVLASGEIIWTDEEQKNTPREQLREVNHGIWNRTIAQFDQLPLWEGEVPGWREDGDQPRPSLIFFPAAGEQLRGTVIVSHGGGFVMRAGHEGFHTARRFLDLGFNVAVLTYRLAPYTRMDALADIQRAVRLLRANRERLHISDRIALLGYSAGGMLSANGATHYDAGNPQADDPVERQSCRPDAAVLCYGAFAMASFPGRMFENPFGDGRAERVYLAAEKNITTDTPPFFIWQTISDDPRHGLAFAKELSDYGVPFELHIFPDGKHGVGLADGNNDCCECFPHLAHWSALAGEWLTMQGL